MKKVLTVLFFCAAATCAQSQEPPQDTHIIDGLTSVAAIAGETKNAEQPQDTATVVIPVQEIPLWKQKLYYGYNFDIYYHGDSRSDRKENGWSISVTPEIGWRVKERLHMGVRLSGGYQDVNLSYTTETENGTETYKNLRVRQGSWEVMPYGRYRLKTLFNDKVGIWVEAHLFTGMQYPQLNDEETKGTDYFGLRHSITYGAQISPVITYQFNRKSTLQLFFSIISFGYSGSTQCYTDPLDGHKYNEHVHDVIIFSGRLRNLLNNQFTPGLYGLKFGVQKSF